MSYNPFHGLTRNQVRILRRRFIACSETPPPEEVPVIEWLKARLDEVVRPET